MAPYMIEMQLPNGEWEPVPGYECYTLDDAVGALRSIPDWDRDRYRVAQLVYRYEPVPAGLLGLSK